MKKLQLIIVTLMVVTAFIGVTKAYFSDSATVTSNEVTVGDW